MTEREANLAERSSSTASSYALAAGIGAAIFVLLPTMLYLLFITLPLKGQVFVWLVLEPIANVLEYVIERFTGEIDYSREARFFTMAISILATAGAITGIIINTIALLIRKTRANK